jgi:hypothetical protein
MARITIFILMKGEAFSLNLQYKEKGHLECEGEIIHSIPYDQGNRT